MTARKTNPVASPGEELGLKLLQSVREMKARNFSRSTEVKVNDVVRLINLIPAHDTYIEGYRGMASVLRKKLPAQKSIGVESDPKVLKHWAGNEVPNSEEELISARAGIEI